MKPRACSNAILAAAALALVPAPAAAGDPAKGRDKALQSCATCHGATGISQVPDAPHIAGQPEIYLLQQLKAYREGKRKHEQMEIVVRSLTESEVEDVAAWYSSIRIRVEPP